MWGNRERCHQFDDSTTQMMKLAYQQALTDNVCWNKVGENKFTFACHLANNLKIEVLFDPFKEYTIALAPNITLATLSIKAGLQVGVQIEGKQLQVRCLIIDEAGFMTTTTDQNGLYSLQIDGQAKSPGLPSLREVVTTIYGDSIWLGLLPGFARRRGCGRAVANLAEQGQETDSKLETANSHGSRSSLN